jgi:hypothetical protein
VATGEAKTLTTSPEGLFEFLALRPATYEVVAEAKGFRRLHLAEIVVNVGSVVRTDLHFEVGEITQVVEVTTETPLIEPDRTSVNRSVDLKEVSNLPMLGRDILSLALTAPGTIQGAPGTQVVAFSVAGMRTQSNNYTLDGVSNNDPQVNGPLNLFHLTDAIQEFNVQTSIASTDVGRSSGAQVSIITKSGTNAVHGTLFYTGRNDLLDANDFFLNRAGKKKKCAAPASVRRHGWGSDRPRQDLLVFQLRGLPGQNSATSYCPSADCRGAGHCHRSGFSKGAGILPGCEHAASWRHQLDGNRRYR